MLHNLPQDLLEIILKQLPILDLLRIPRLCKAIRLSNYFWYETTHLNNYDQTINYKNMVIEKYFMRQNNDYRFYIACVYYDSLKNHPMWERFTYEFYNQCDHIAKKNDPILKFIKSYIHTNPIYILYLYDGFNYNNITRRQIHYVPSAQNMNKILYFCFNSNNTYDPNINYLREFLIYKSFIIKDESGNITIKYLLHSNYYTINYKYKDNKICPRNTANYTIKSTADYTIRAIHNALYNECLTARENKSDVITADYTIHDLFLE